MRNSLFLALAIAGALSAPVKAADFVESFKQCAAEQDSLKRLLCFDNLAKVVNYDQQAPIALPSAPVAATPAASTAVAVAPKVTKPMSDEEKFGAERKISQQEEKISQVSYTIKSLEKTLRKKWRFTFENGQQWEQVDSSAGTFKKGEQVVIKRGLFDAFYLKRPDANRTIKVKRIK